MNYVSETMDLVRQGFALGWNVLSTILDEIGLDMDTYIAIIIGFAVVGLVTTALISNLRGPAVADSSVRAIKDLHKQGK